MSNFQNRFKNNFTQIPNDVINDKELSLKAKGLLIYLISKKEGWNFSANNIASQNLEGKTSINNGLKELENLGYLKRIKYKSDNGKFDGIIYVIKNRFDNSDNQLTVNGKTVDGKTVNGKTVDGKTVNINNTILSNTILSNTEVSNMYGQNKNFATPTQENQIDLYDVINEVENENNSLNNQKEKKEKSCAKKENRFSKPNIKEIKDYFFEIGCENYNLESEKFFDYYESNGWLVGKSKMKDWKATARNWNRNTKKFNNGQQTNNTSTATGNAYEWKPDLQEQLESAAEHLRKINSF